jgi:hypothetical protein
MPTEALAHFKQMLARHSDNQIVEVDRTTIALGASSATSGSSGGFCMGRIRWRDFFRPKG